jgi:hypothetical protein
MNTADATPQSATRHHGLEFVDRHRAAKQVSLVSVAAGFGQKIAL